MYKILLCCSAGITTSMLVNSMKKEAEKENEKTMIWAVAETALDLSWADADIILVAPQARSDINRIKELVNDSIPVELIDGVDFSSMNGKAVLQQALSILKK
ncbi:MAG: PTS sugar transporter subunit IIB [Thomasclavelia sp.]|jgi:PTS system cellobiose-specific IIB component|nr:PTS sugar transporter subunit IIB [Thomasclavelia sp.]